MSFFENLFHKKKEDESVILIDIGADGIAGAYARYTGSELPTLLYARRVPIETRSDELPDRAMLRALNVLGNDLIREGAPLVARATGSGTADMILVSIDAPWQETSVRIENFESEEPFTFTKNLVTERLEKTMPISSKDKMLVDESIIGTTANGYETNNPYGQKIHRASITVLTSLIEQKIADNVIGMLRSLFHTTNILPITGSSLRYQAMRVLFPHEADAMILDATGGPLSVALIRKGVFVTLVETTILPDQEVWASTVIAKLVEIAKDYQLPRTIFLLARESNIESLRKTLDSANLSSLWLSSNPPKIIPVLKSLMSTSVRQTTTNAPDSILLLMALFWKNRNHSSSEEIS